MKDNGHKVIQIANYLDRNKTTIYRELSKTNYGSQNYEAYFAHKMTKNNMVRSNQQCPSPEVIQIIEKKILMEQWSPEQISGWLKLTHNIHVSHTWIYQYVDKDRLEGGELFNHMRRGKYSRCHKEYKGIIPDRISIEHRPEIVNQRGRLGDYEIDLIVGIKNQGAILSIIDRMSRYCVLQKLHNKKAEAVSNAVIEQLRSLGYPIFTITSDNGNEFILHKEITKKLGIAYYFAHPYASYERGSIENLNGLVRQYIPKGTDFSSIESSSIEQIQKKLNARPRKILGYLTPTQYVDSISHQELRLQV
jgi:IS30 family transposase